MLILGNGPSADTPAVAALAQEQSVMRINNWRPGTYTGIRCSIWGTSYAPDVAPRIACKIWWCGSPYGVQPDYAKIVKEQTQPYDRVADQDLLDRLYRICCPQFPSTGIILAYMAAEAGFPVTLAGFDSFDPAESHHYWGPNTGHPASVWHSRGAEQHLIQLLVERHGVRILQ